MKSSLRRAATPANVIAIVALSVSLGGTAVAANMWRGIDIVDGSLTGADIRDGSLQGRDINNGSLTGSDVASSSLRGGDIANGSLSGGDVNDGTLSGSDVLNESLTGSDIDDETLSGSDVLDESLTGSDVDDGTIAAVDLAAGVVVQPGGTLATGTTLRGVFAPSNVDGTDVQSVGHGVSFGGFSLPSRPVAWVLEYGATPTAECPGTSEAPDAASGNLCLYVAALSSADGVYVSAIDPSKPTLSGISYTADTDLRGVWADGTVATFGFKMVAGDSTPNNGVQPYGSWAVTA